MLGNNRILVDRLVHTMIHPLVKWCKYLSLIHTQKSTSFTSEENNAEVIRVILNTTSASFQVDELCNLAKVTNYCFITCFISRLSLFISFSDYE